MASLIPFERKNGGMRKRGNLADFMDVDKMFESFFNDTIFPAHYSNSGHMKVDIKETKKDYILEAELPGINKEDINIETDDDRLTISVAREEDSEDKGSDYIRKERRTSSMVRSFAIDGVQNDKITAKHENGILTVVLPKKQDSKGKAKRINIS
ncbi:Hsp20/alpha crystallin family protein [Herbivorax sp. ANBcel31]|uniref:Hsp20/alpha crystallin family protein n=1 Tax=Herbivorax sp. ANBcel31 TaxID=3069754 RepID=UPI0027B0A67B|nr:Hsp20/alpha crystallin family protein [Herbivorax sp. ANBcel31]MDQ2088062.1 Hsp20/alpha crystallin family protein [Herbivorax sp. ANBcel31]